MILNYLLKDETFGEKMVRECKEMVEEFGNFFKIIKENTYDILCDKFGSTAINIVLATLGVLILMFIINKVINR